jgi:hypothetical protein
MRPIQFQVCRASRNGRWAVRCRNSTLSGNSTYGAYLDKEQALLDAIDAARDALQDGKEAQVWIKNRSTSARVF